MLEIRKVKKIITGQRTVDGAGVSLIRVFGYYDTKDFDPFLMLDAFDSTNPDDYIKGFPFHPHRGIETITYLLSGDIEHKDSMGNKGSILDGDCQWMTAGSGIIHQEMPKASKRMQGLQLWLNLPAKDKMTKPKYRGISKNDIQVIEEGTVTIRVISGKYKEAIGPTECDFVKATYLDIELKANSEWVMETEKDETVFIYVFSGKAKFGDEDFEIEEKHAVLFEEGKKFKVNTSDDSVRFVILLGKPIKEPVAWGGPIVMNTREELNLAFDELNNGTFIKENK